MSNISSFSLKRMRGKAAYAAGLGAEQKTTLFLKTQGWTILYTRYKTPAGEIDIIATYENILSFLEVKQRQTHKQAAYAFSPTQKKRVQQAAYIAMSQHPEWQYEYTRFDVFLYDKEGQHQILINALWDE